MSWLKPIRKANGMTQKQVAEAAGIARSSYARIELGGFVPTPKTAKKIAAALGFDWTKFYE